MKFPRLGSAGELRLVHRRELNDSLTVKRVGWVRSCCRQAIDINIFEFTVFAMPGQVAGAYAARLEREA